MEKLSTKEISEAFAPKQRKLLVLPKDLGVLRMEEVDSLGWVDIGTNRGFIVCKYKGTLRGLVLLRNNISHEGSRRRAGMCNLCKTIHTGQGIRMFVTQDLKDPRRRIGDYYCDDLKCNLRAQKLIPLPPNQMQETLGIDERAVRYLEGLDRLFERCYG